MDFFSALVLWKRIIFSGRRLFLKFQVLLNYDLLPSWIPAWPIKIDRRSTRAWFEFILAKFQLFVSRGALPVVIDLKPWLTNASQCTTGRTRSSRISARSFMYGWSERANLMEFTRQRSRMRMLPNLPKPWRNHDETMTKPWRNHSYFNANSTKPLFYRNKRYWFIILLFCNIHWFRR